MVWVRSIIIIHGQLLSLIWHLLPAVAFIQQLTSGANTICNRGGKKTITSDHILEGLLELGFSDIHPKVAEFTLAQQKQEQQKASAKRAKRKFKEDEDEEYLIQRQRELMEAASLQMRM